MCLVKEMPCPGCGSIAQSRSTPVLLTVPSSVIPPPSSATLSKRFWFKTGFDVLINCATFHSPYTNRSTTILRQARTRTSTLATRPLRRVAFVSVG